MKNKFNFILIFVSFFTFFTGITNVNAQFAYTSCTQSTDNKWYSSDEPYKPYETLDACNKANDPIAEFNNQASPQSTDVQDSNTSADNAAVAGSGKSIKLTNPLKTINTIPEFVKSVLDIVMKVGVPLVALAIIYTGYLFIAAQGKPEELKKAKDALVYVFIGSMILLGAYVIAEALIGTVNAIRGK